MDNQHRHITGYRELSQTEINAMNLAKQYAATIGGFIEQLKQNQTCDQRWLAIAETDLQKGFMSLVRAIAQPTTF